MPPPSPREPIPLDYAQRPRSRTRASLRLILLGPVCGALVALCHSFAFVAWSLHFDQSGSYCGGGSCAQIVAATDLVLGGVSGTAFVALLRFFELFFGRRVLSVPQFILPPLLAALFYGTVGYLQMRDQVGYEWFCELYLLLPGALLSIPVLPCSRRSGPPPLKRGVEFPRVPGPPLHW